MEHNQSFSWRQKYSWNKKPFLQHATFFVEKKYSLYKNLFMEHSMAIPYRGTEQILFMEQNTHLFVKLKQTQKKFMEHKEPSHSTKQILPEKKLL